MPNMNEESRAALADKLTNLALDMTEHPADAVSILMRSAATILQRTFGDEGAADLLHQSTGEAVAALKLIRATAAATKQ